GRIVGLPHALGAERRPPPSVGCDGRLCRGCAGDRLGKSVQRARAHAAIGVRGIAGSASRCVSGTPCAARSERSAAMTETANERIRIEAPAARCWDVAVDFESYPEWVRDVKEVKTLERNPDGLGTRVEYRAAALGKSVRYILEYDFSDAPNSFSWKF